MAMRSQIFEAELTYDTPSRMGAGDHPLGVPGGRVQVFLSTFGHTISTQASDFIVIENIGSSPVVPINYADRDPAKNTVWFGSVQILVNTTYYFLWPNGQTSAGVPSLAAPYPISVDFQPVFRLYPDIYILAGQTWDIIYTLDENQRLIPPNSTTVRGAIGPVHVFVKYTLYDGPDMVIATNLLEMGITVKPENIDWFKRQLIAKKKAST